MRQTNSQQGYQIIVKYDKNVCTFFDQKNISKHDITVTANGEVDVQLSPYGILLLTQPLHSEQHIRANLIGTLHDI